MGKFNENISEATGIKLNVISHNDEKYEYLIDVSFSNMTNKYLSFKSLKEIGYDGDCIIFFNIEENFEKQYTKKNGKFKVAEILEAILDFESELREVTDDHTRVFFEGFDPKEFSKSNRFQIIWGS